jgi:hypothetical protein
MDEGIGELIEGEPGLMESLGESGEDLAKGAGAGDLMGGNRLEICSADFLVETGIGGPALGSAFDGFVKNSRDEKRIISDMGTDEKGLFRGGVSQGDEHIGDILDGVAVAVGGGAEAGGLRKGFEERGEVIADSAVIEPWRF